MEALPLIVPVGYDRLLPKEQRVGSKKMAYYNTVHVGRKFSIFCIYLFYLFFFFFLSISSAGMINNGEGLESFLTEGCKFRCKTVQGNSIMRPFFFLVLVRLLFH